MLRRVGNRMFRPFDVSPTHWTFRPLDVLPTHWTWGALEAIYEWGGPYLPYWLYLTNSVFVMCLPNWTGFRIFSRWSIGGIKQIKATAHLVVEAREGDETSSPAVAEKLCDAYVCHSFNSTIRRVRATSASSPLDWSFTSKMWSLKWGGYRVKTTQFVRWQKPMKLDKTDWN